MNLLPENPDLSQLRRQAKELHARYRAQDTAALQRLRQSLPAARGLSQAEVAAAGYRLHDAQSCLAREYGFASWGDLKAFVEAARLRSGDVSALRRAFLGFVYAGEVVGGMNRSRPALAERLLKQYPEIEAGCPTTACAVGDVEAVRAAILRDRGWIHAAGGPLSLPPLVAACHSGLLAVADRRPGILDVIRLLLAEGANPNQSIASRWPPASVEFPDARVPLTALYGAAGVSFDADATRLLLAAGADPNDNESLYHSLDRPSCTALLLAAGAQVSGTNALFRCLDFDDLDTLEMLLSHAAGAPELSHSGLYFHAIRRRRSLSHFQALLDAGVDPDTTNEEGMTPAAFALRHGLSEVATLLGGTAELSETDQFLAACAAADLDAARAMLDDAPDLFARLQERDLRLLPELAAAGATAAVRVMVDLGWPIEATGGEWSASALNQAVFRGDRELTRFLLDRGASWRAEHGFGDDVSGTLCWASLNRPVEGGDWSGCAEVLLAYGMPAVRRDRTDPHTVIMEGRPRQFSEDVTRVLLQEGA